MQRLLATALVLLYSLAMFRSPPEALRESDRIRIAEAKRIADALGERLWPGWQGAPFGVLLVAPDKEFLIHHPQAAADFEYAGFDSMLGGPVYSRARRFDTNLLATFPAVGGVPTVVIGRPEKTEASTSTRWVMTLLHEHFHQWQQSQEDYFSSVNALGLSRGDTTGAWMLDYAFPYDSARVNDAFSELRRRLLSALEANGSHALQEGLRAYLDARQKFRETLSVDDYAYFGFQIWQEGIARYTEYRLAEWAGVLYRPTVRFKELPDYTPFEIEAEALRAHISSELTRLSLKKARRSAFYHVGAAEGLLLDRVNPAWRQLYMTKKFSVEAYFHPPVQDADE